MVLPNNTKQDREVETRKAHILENDGSNPPLVLAPVVGYGKPAEHVRVLYCKQIIGSNPVGAVM